MQKANLPTRMTEGEVALLLADHFLRLPHAEPTVTVAIDGAVVETTKHGRLFEIETFLSHLRWRLVEQRGKRPWHGAYTRDAQQLHLSSTSGVGDVVVQIANRRIVAECKGGPLIKVKGSKEHRILKEAIGQAVVSENNEDMPIVAVPDTPPFRLLAESWQQRPLIRKLGLQIVLVAQDGGVSGLDLG
jgi:hypothetical protein